MDFIKIFFNKIASEGLDLELTADKKYFVRSFIYRKEEPVRGKYALKLVASGKKNDNSAGAYIFIDSIDFFRKRIY